MQVVLRGIAYFWQKWFFNESRIVYLYSKWIKYNFIHLKIVIFQFITKETDGN